MGEQYYIISEKQTIELDEWKEAIKKVFGEYGLYTFKFTPDGIGCSLVVYSHIANKELDLTDINSY